MIEIRLPSNLQKYRKAYNFSQEDLADRLQISRQAVAKWENGINYPDITNLTLLAGLYGVTVDALIYGNDCSGSAGIPSAAAISGQRLAEFLLCAKKTAMPETVRKKSSPAVRKPMTLSMKIQGIGIWILIWEAGFLPEKRPYGKSSRKKGYQSGQ